VARAQHVTLCVDFACFTEVAGCEGGHFGGTGVGSEAVDNVYRSAPSVGTGVDLRSGEKN
jgi:hypothetical protein